MTYSIPTGNGLIDETEFLQWVAKIQALKDESTSTSSSSSQAEQDDDLTQDLVAAFRWVIGIPDRIGEIQL